MSLLEMSSHSYALERYKILKEILKGNTLLCACKLVSLDSLDRATHAYMLPMQGLANSVIISNAGLMFIRKTKLNLRNLNFKDNC